MGAPHIPTTRSVSPSQLQHNINLPQQQSGDTFGAMSQQAMFSTTGGSTSDFSGLSDNEMHSPVGHMETQYRSNSFFGPYLASRTRQNTIQTSTAGIGESGAGAFSPFQANSTDSFGAQSASYQQHQSLSNGLRNLEFSNEQGVNALTKPVFTNMDPFGVNNNSASNVQLLQSQQINKILQAQAVQQQQHMQNYQNPAALLNGLMQTQSAHSQTPFGPHVSTANGTGYGSNGVSITSNQEEICTIFVVGFPEDMQEREFQNMFTFSAGFEAATLKIPNKDLTAYGSNAPPTSATINGRNSLAYGMGYPYNGVNDPYNLVTMNQGGVVVDGRDGTTSSWSNMDPDFSMGIGGSSGGGQNNPLPQRKQIIGFAKFRTRAEALAARDLLQGRRVDIEKGAVLKAEMAKKNLHTKRGVGPLSVPMPATNGQPSVASMMGGMNGMMGGMPEGLSSVTSMLSPGVGPGAEALVARERELGALGAMGLGGMRRERDRMELQEEERESRRRREPTASVSSFGGMQSSGSVGMFGPRGPRERQEEEERDRRRNEKEKELILAYERSGGRLRQSASMTSNASLNESAFHSGLMRGSGSLASLVSPSQESAYGVNGNGYPFPYSAGQEGANGNAFDGWPPAPQSAGASIGPRSKLLSLSINGAPQSFSTSTNGMPTRPSSSRDSSPTDDNLGEYSFLAGNTTIRATYTHTSEAATPPPQSEKGASEANGSSALSGPTFGLPLTTHSSVSSLGSRSRPYSPPNETEATSSHSLSSSGFLPNLDLQQQQQQNHIQRRGNLDGYAPFSIPTSGSSSVSAGSRSSSSSSVDGEISQALGAVDISSPHGTVSPQLPSPNSGSGSSTGARGLNQSDQNPPINTLYVGNLPTSPVPGSSPSLLEDNLRSLFSRCTGYRKLCFRQKSNGPMCFVEFEDVEHAAKAMNDLYGHQLFGLVKGGIRLSFSKNPLGVRTTPTNMTSTALLQQNGTYSMSSNSSYSNMQDAVNSRHSVHGVLQVDTSTLRNARRDQGDVTSPYSFSASPPPPRFFSPDSTSFGGFMSHNASAVPPSLSRSTSLGFSSSFAPFGSSTPPNATPQFQPADPLPLSSLTGALPPSPNP